MICHSSYLNAGVTYTNVAIALDPALDENTDLYAMPHKDDNNQAYDFPEADAPYVEGGTPVTAAPETESPATTAPPETSPGDEEPASVSRSR